MTVALETFIPDIAVECSGASNPLILSAVRTAVIEFCRKSLYWQEEADPVTLTEEVAEYALSTPTGRQIVQIMSINLDGGGSSTMVFQGRVVNNPTTNGRSIRERSVSDIVYIGY